MLLSADDFFYALGGGQYSFNPGLLPQAHADCQARTRAALAEYGPGAVLVLLRGLPGSGKTSFGGTLGAGVAVVANTFSQRWEIEPYLRLAAEVGVRVTVVDLFDGGLTDEALAARGLHGVPVAGIAAMRARWEHAWRDGDPRAPWERG